MSMWWSFGLTALGVTGLYLAGCQKKSGWMLGLLAQFIWIAYAIVTKQYGFILGALIYGSAYARNWYRWSVAEKQLAEAEASGIILSE